MKDTVKAFPTEDTDMVLDVKYDFYGKQLATCSADQFIRIYDLSLPPSDIDSTNGTVNGAVNGEVNDEVKGEVNGAANGAANGGISEDPNMAKQADIDSESPTWILNDSFRAHSASVVKLDYASPEFGHLLLSVSYDRTMKIWQEETGGYNTAPAGPGSKWAQLASLEDSLGPLYDGCFLPAHLGLKCCSIGSDFRFRIYQAQDPSNLKEWSLIEEIGLLSGTPSVDAVRNSLQSDFNISWCPSRFSTDKFVISSLDRVTVYYRDPIGGDIRLGCQLHEEENSLVRSVSWAPSMGRSYHLIATASLDGTMRIFQLSEYPDTSKKSSGSLRYEAELLGEFNDHGSDVWRVNWNLTGTILSTCGGDGMVRLYKAFHANDFRCLSVISAKEV